MSQFRYNVSKIYDPRINITNNLVGADSALNFSVEEGSPNLNYYQTACNSATNGTITWNSLNWSPDLGLSRFMYYSIPVRLTINASKPPGSTVSSPPIIQDGLCGPRSHFATVVTSSALTLGTVTLNTNPSQFITALSHYGYKNNDMLNKYTYGFSHIIDNDNEYRQGNNNVLGTYNNSPLFGVESRGAYKNVLWQQVGPDVLNGDGTYTAIVDILFQEPLWNSPMSFDEAYKSCIPGLTTFSLNIVSNLSNANLLWSQAPAYYPDGSAGTTVTINSIIANVDKVNPTYGECLLHYTLYSIPPSIAMYPSKHPMVYDYYQVYQASVSSAKDGSTGITVPPQSSILSPPMTPSTTPSSVPKMIYIFVQENPSLIKSYQPFNFGTITNINIQFNNRQSSMNSITSTNGNKNNVDLYKLICSKNNCKMSYLQWSKYIGSVIQINPVEDLNLSNFVEGELNNTAFTAQVQWFNNTTYEMNDPQINVLFVYSGVLSYDGNGGFVQNLNIAQPQWLRTHNILENKQYVYTKEQENFLGGMPIAALLATIAPFIKPAVKGVATVAKHALPELRKHVSGYDTAFDIAQKGSEYLSGMGLEGGGVIAGRMQSRSSLHNKMRRY